MNTNSGPRERISPGFFGNSPYRLYACHHYAATSSVSDEAVLICHATGHEYERTHRAMRQLAVQFARTGYHTMRFDYFGTGDSEGECDQVSLVQWRKDITDAIDEIRRVSDCERVCVVGLRLGATLAAQVASDSAHVENLVLYAPVTDGRLLITEWMGEQAKHAARHSLPRSRAVEEILGFPLTASFRAELDGLVLPEPDPAVHRVLVLEQRAAKHAVQRLAGTLASRGARVTVETIDDPVIWQREPLEAIVPFKLLRRIVSWLGGGQW